MTRNEEAATRDSGPAGVKRPSRTPLLLATAILLCAAVLPSVLQTYAQPPAENDDRGGVRFYDARSQAAEFIAKYHSLSLSAEHQKTRKEALSSIPAPCCKDYSIETCCCPCNLAKSVWGLAGMLIAERGYDAARVKTVVEEWIQFTNPGGYTGDACYRGGCGKPFNQNGCGGMDEKKIS